MRQPRCLVVGNWKMNRTVTEGVDLARGIMRLLSTVNHQCQVVLCPPFTALSKVGEVVLGTGVEIGGQNVYADDEGAYTGEISAPMLRDCGCTYVIIGHSERRQLFGETDEHVRRKVKAVLRHGIRPIICVGETQEQRDGGETERVVVGQLLSALQGLTENEISQLVVAYEPVWAIGTGRAASAVQAEEVHARLRTVLLDARGGGDGVPLLYGGSVKPDNAGDFFAQPSIDGALVGGASLDPDSFVSIIMRVVT